MEQKVTRVVDANKEEMRHFYFCEYYPTVEDNFVSLEVDTTIPSNVQEMIKIVVAVSNGTSDKKMKAAFLLPMK